MTARPAQVPNHTSEKPRACPTSGKDSMATVPSSVLMAMAKAISSSRARMTGARAAMAVLPQTAAPTAMRVAMRMGMRSAPDPVGDGERDRHQRPDQQQRVAAHGDDLVQIEPGAQADDRHGQRPLHGQPQPGLPVHRWAREVGHHEAEADGQQRLAEHHGHRRREQPVQPPGRQGDEAGDQDSSEDAAGGRPLVRRRGCGARVMWPVSGEGPTRSGSSSGRHAPMPSAVARAPPADPGAAGAGSRCLDAALSPYAG